ncbi:MAG: sensor histidine kinase [Firmicutes bacterium]|nr:sensor histidine kinase [Bacillota bacterium]
MSTKERTARRSKLNRELLILIAADTVVSAIFYFFLHSTAGTLAYEYCEANQIGLDDLQSIMLDEMVLHLSILGSVILFITLFLVFVGRKLAYIRKLTDGIEALRTHRMQYEIPLEGNNELTELAESINYLAETERQLKAVERNLSHDIRTPLTAIMSYAEYMQGRENLSKEELDDFLELTKSKAEQIKALTERLLDGGSRLSEITDGRLLMAQLTEEWEEGLEEKFDCSADISRCPTFGGQFDVEELRRIFDNLSSNVLKYADPDAPVSLTIDTEKRRIVIRQSNKKDKSPKVVESRKIGITSMETIAKHYGGYIETKQDETDFAIKIVLFEV